jgi:hypothetical protein
VLDEQFYYKIESYIIPSKYIVNQTVVYLFKISERQIPVKTYLEAQTVRFNTILIVSDISEINKLNNGLKTSMLLSPITAQTQWTGSSNPGVDLCTEGAL